MPVTLEAVVKQLTDSGIISPGELASFVPPKASPKDAEELLRQLLKQNLLTKFQAQQCAAGRSKALILGNYILLDKIGAGGMGQVFKAEHRRMKRLVAIKMLPKAVMGDAAAAARFQREVEAAAKLRHPNIVAADDADEANGVHFLVMEYVEGADLAALVKKSGPLPVAKAVNYILQAARGLEFAHDQGVIHRDIKPANLLLDKAGKLKVLDMGLARVDSPGSDSANQAELTGTGAVMGTVDYMAPEQALNTKRADARSDVYSLGCTLYFLVVGKQIYQGESLMEKLVAHREQPIPALQAAQGGVPKAIEAVFRKMVAKNPAERYQTMSEVVAALQNSGTQQPLPTAVPLSDTRPDLAAATVLQSARAMPATGSGAIRQVAASKTSQRKPRHGKKQPGSKKLFYAAAGGGTLGLAVLAGVVFIVLSGGGKPAAKQSGPRSASPSPSLAAAEPTKTEPVHAIASTDAPSPPPNDSEVAPADAARQKWMAEVARLPAEKQVEAVARQLQELNPEFDGKVGPRIQDAVVIELSALADNLTDLSPLQALPGLTSLVLNGSGPGKGNLADLSPLSGMDLANFACESTKVTDLSPLEDCPRLKTLNVRQTLVTPEGVAALQKALPNCQISWDGATQGTPAAAPMPKPPVLAAADPLAPAAADANGKPADPNDPRQPIPNDAARAQAEQLFQDVFKADLTQTRSRDQKSALAEKILKQVDGTADDPASQYVMLQESLRLSLEAADLGLVERAIKRLADVFVIDANETWLEALEKATQKPRLPAANKALAEAALGHVDELAASENYDLATRFQNIATATAPKAKDPVLLKNVVEHGKTLSIAKQDWERRQEAIATLARQPEDPAANLIVGRYLCFTKADWQAGFEKLALGSDATLKELGQKSLAEPEEPAAQAELGEAWAKAAESAKKSAKTELQSGARYWLAKAVTGLTGLAKVKAEQQLGQLPGESIAATPSTPPRPGRRAKQPESSSSRERQAAEWALHRHGKIGIMMPKSSDEQTIESLAELPGQGFLLTTIDLRQVPEIPQQEYANLEGLVHLQTLRLRATSIDDNGLAHVKDLVNLTLLELSGSQITDNGLFYLKDLKNLETLLLYNRPISRAGLEQLKNLTNITDLHLSGPHITDDCLLSLKPFSHLRVLQLSNAPITDAGLDTLQGFPSLNVITLIHARITDAGLPKLYVLKNLNRLVLRGTKISDAAVSKFQAALPQCKVQF